MTRAVDATESLSTETLARRLRSFELFERLAPETRSSIASRLAIRVFPKGSFVVAAGQSSGRDTYFVLGGHVRACACSENGRLVQFEELGEGMMFGELSAIDARPRGSDCIAVSDTTLAVMPARCFLDAVRAHPDVAEALVRRLTAMVRLQMRKVFEISTATVSQRVRLELLRMASREHGTEREPESRSDPIAFGEVPTHADLAARIGTHREAVSRELKSLESSGIIVWRRDRHEIVDLARLTEVSQA